MTMLDSGPALAAAARLAAALDEVRPPCHDDDRWTSDSPDDRARAAELCAGCAVLVPCGTFADAADERFHVWGGVDRSRLVAAREATA